MKIIYLVLALFALLSGFNIKTKRFSFSYDGLLATLYRAIFNKEIEE